MDIKEDFICCMFKYFDLINKNAHSHDTQVIYMRSMYIYMLEHINVLTTFTERQRLKYIFCVLHKSDEFLKRIHDPITLEIIRDVKRMYSSFLSRL